MADYISEIELGNGSTYDLRDKEAAHKTELLDLIYPVGSIYLSTSNTSPATLFGGTWERWGSGRTLVGVNTNDPDFEVPGKVGGLKTHKHSNSETNLVTLTTLGSSNRTGASSTTNTGSTTLTAAQSGVPQHTHGMKHNHTQESHKHTHGHSHTASSNRKYVYASADTAALETLRSIGTGTPIANVLTIKANEGTPTVTLATSTGSVNSADTSSTTPSIKDSTKTSTDKNTSASASEGHIHYMDHTHSLNNHTHTIDAHKHSVKDTDYGSSLPPYITCYMWRRTA